MKCVMGSADAMTCSNPPNWNHSTKERETPMNDNKKERETFRVPANSADYICSNTDCPCQGASGPPPRHNEHRLALSDEHKIAFLLGICTRMAQALEAKGLGEAYPVLSAFAVESLETVRIMPLDVLDDADEATDELIDNASRIVLMATQLMAGR